MPGSAPVVDSPFAKWSYAAKPKSWPKLLVPMALGQGLGAYVAGGLDAAALLFGVLFVVADLLYIVFLNDWADAQVDTIKRRMFPDGCSPKTIPDGILGAQALLSAGLLAGAAALGIALAFGALLDRPWLLSASASALAIFWAYTLPPLRLNYRGGGELLEGVGVGFVLPWLNAYAQSGAVWSEPYWLLVPFVVLSSSSAIASGLADERSDLEGGKTTVASVFGNRAARRAVEVLVVLGVLGWLLIPVPEVPAWVRFVGAATAAAFLPRLWATTRAAVTDAFRAQGLYKRELHLGIWLAGTAVALVLFLLAEVS